ncbi:histone-binding protein N1/N2-like isoform X1 [Watersipora subatra]|uniref:histone-binding protein N1/N2-like isoform X1 n=1 Tax=Watersipora subatra TaxID=2589382 RepID=UPI00355C48B1
MSGAEVSQANEDNKVIGEQKQTETDVETKPVAANDNKQELQTSSNEESMKPGEAEDSGNQIDNQQSPGLDIDAEALKLLNSGKRHLACDDFPQAVEALAEACELLSEKYGDNASEVGESYFYYGKSLLELARMENGVLGNALDGVTPEEENEADLSESDQFEKASKLPEVERETIVNDVYSAMAAEEKSEAKIESEEKDESVKDEEKEGGDVSANSEVVDSAENSVEETASDGAEMESADDAEQAAGSSQEETDADDIPNLQLAWEVLELAKTIYLRQSEESSDNSRKVRLSEVYRALGEVSLETGVYEQATQDIASCLEWQSMCMAADDRRIAETHYQLGNAHSLFRDYTKAIEHLRKSVSVLEARIANIEASDEITEKENLEKERNEIQALLPDIVAKIEDVEDESRNALKAETEVKAMLTSQSGITTTTGFGDSSGSTQTANVIATKANDISNLVRKRKTDEKDDQGVKKVKQEMAHGDSVNKENGTVELASTDGK